MSLHCKHRLLTRSLDVPAQREEQPLCPGVRGHCWKRHWLCKGHCWDSPTLNTATLWLSLLFSSPGRCVGNILESKLGRRLKLSGPALGRCPCVMEMLLQPVPCSRAAYHGKQQGHLQTVLGKHPPWPGQKLLSRASGGVPGSQSLMMVVRQIRETSDRLLHPHAKVNQTCQVAPGEAHPARSVPRALGSMGPHSATMVSLIP